MSSDVTAMVDSDWIALVSGDESFLDAKKLTRNL